MAQPVDVPEKRDTGMGLCGNINLLMFLGGVNFYTRGTRNWCVRYAPVEMADA